jgi:hypothetical protein
MSEPKRCHRLDGLEPDNLLAFLALLGLLRALEAARPEWRPRAAWDLDQPPLRPVLCLAELQTIEAICVGAVEGVENLVSSHDFGGAPDLKFNVGAAKSLCATAIERAERGDRYFADLCTALFSVVATNDENTEVDPTPLAYPSVATSNFLKGFQAISSSPMPENRPRDPTFPKGPAECIAQALFQPWSRLDRPVGLRWDPEEAKRHAYQWRAPTKDPPTTQHGANRLAVIGLSLLTAAPTSTGPRVGLSILGGDARGDRFSLAWPVWREPASLAAIRALLSHPELRTPGALEYLGVHQVLVAQRISLDRLKNFRFAIPTTRV